MLLDPHRLDAPEVRSEPASAPTLTPTSVRLSITAEISFSHDAPTDLLAQFEVAMLSDQQVLASETLLSSGCGPTRVPAHGALGERVWLVAKGDCTLAYRADVVINRTVLRLDSLSQLALPQLPGAVVEYLFDSRYCQADPMHGFVQEQFGELAGGARVSAICDWIAENFRYVPGSSNVHTSALDSFADRRGICRDYAHVLITMARASGIPARYASGYAPGVNPPDFHAVAQVYLSDPQHGGQGAWQIVDATGMTQGGDCAIIGVGRDAGDVAFLTSFGHMRFDSSQVQVTHRQAEDSI